MQKENGIAGFFNNWHREYYNCVGCLMHSRFAKVVNYTSKYENNEWSGDSFRVGSKTKVREALRLRLCAVSSGTTHNGREHWERRRKEVSRTNQCSLGVHLKCFWCRLFLFKCFDMFVENLWARLCCFSFCLSATIFWWKQKIIIKSL